MGLVNACRWLHRECLRIMNSAASTGGPFNPALPPACAARRSPSQSLAHDRGLTAYYENVLRGGDGEGAGEPGAGAGVRKGAAAEHGGGRGQAAAAAGSGGAGGGAAAAAWGGGVSEEALSDGEPDVGGGGGGGEGGAQRPGSSPVAR